MLGPSQAACTTGFFPASSAGDRNSYLYLRDQREVGRLCASQPDVARWVVGQMGVMYPVMASGVCMVFTLSRNPEVSHILPEGLV